MGDRGNVKVLDCVQEGEESRGVYLYTHWSGTELPGTVRTALARRQRWDDHSYLARIIFCTMIEGQGAEETGFGIGLSPPDNEHPIIVVDPNTQTLWLEGDGSPYVKAPDPPRGRCPSRTSSTAPSSRAGTDR